MSWNMFSDTKTNSRRHAYNDLHGADETQANENTIRHLDNYDNSGAWMSTPRHSVKDHHPNRKNRHGRRICSELDLFQLEGIERALGGEFDRTRFTTQSFVASFQRAFNNLAQETQGSNENAPTIGLRSALTYARQALGRSGRNMEP